MLLRRRLLTALQGAPEIEFEGLCLRCPSAKVRELRQALSQLAAEGWIEMHEPGKYRLLPNKLVLPTAAPPSDFIRPIPLDRLMAGR